MTFETVLLDRIDPDDNYYENIGPENFGNISQYIAVSDFNSLASRSNFFTIINYNIRSFNANSDTFFSMLNSDVMPEIYVFTETWFTEENKVNLNNYKSYHVLRLSGQRSGGVSIFVRDDLVSNLVTDLCISNSTIECCTVEVRINEKQYLIVGIYKPHGESIENFCSSLLEILDSNLMRNKICCLLGDFNINILNPGRAIEPFLTMLQSFHYLNLIHKPTRFSSSNLDGSIIDHIWINEIGFYSSGIILHDMTDHLPTFFQIEKTKPDSVSKVKISFRLDNESCRLKFRDKFINTNWDSIACDDVNTYMNNFLTYLNKIYIESFPLKIKYISRKSALNPWINSTIRKLIRAKSTYFKLFKLKIVSCSENNAYKNQVKQITKNAKKAYYKNLFLVHQKNMKKSWSIIRSIIAANSKTNSINKLLVNNIEYVNDSQIAELFNEYFFRIPLELEESLPQSHLDPLNTVNLNPNLISFPPVNPDEIKSVIDNLKPVKQNINCISVKLLKAFSDILSIKLCDIINLSFTNAIFPECLKVAMIIPIFK